jgi:hypothetical protein
VMSESARILSQPGMRPEVVRQRIAAFEKRFRTAHLFLAYHAAFPLALTPDLLYRLWANFQRDDQGVPLAIPWVAVADVLLSGLCNEVGYELYQMHPRIRSTLLDELKSHPRFGPRRITALSQFLREYVRRQLRSDDPDVRDFARAQEWTGLAYMRPEKAAYELALAYKLLRQQDSPELLRMEALVETFAEQLASVPDFTKLKGYARGMGRLARGDRQGAAAHLEQGQVLQRAGVNLLVPILQEGVAPSQEVVDAAQTARVDVEEQAVPAIAAADLTAKFVVAEPGETIDQLLGRLPADRADRAGTYIVLPAEHGRYTVVRWVEVEQIVTTISQPPR